MAVPKFPELEEHILKQWDERDIFKKTLVKPSPEGNFVFYEGPPTANGRPGIHHLLARAYKDIIPRYKTMRGFHVERKAGWDTHGLPVEIEAEKQLGLKSKTEIEEYGVAAFNTKCRESVWTYKEEWERFTKRSGYWIDLADPYITYTSNYIETLWWITAKINDRDLLYEDYKVVPHCPRCGTTLSSHELALGYDDVDDTSVYVRFALRDKRFANTSFLVWTTTPWTLPGNVALAVGNDIEYTEVALTDGPANSGVNTHLILATARLSVLTESYKVVRTLTGKELVGVEYTPIFNFVKYTEKVHYVASADFVSTTDGTGIVHTAVMYGADDFTLGQTLGLPRVHVVNERGEFLPMVKPWAGMFVKKADPLIIENLKASGALYRAETVHHTYPFCWRCKTPLIYYAKPCWYFKTSAVVKDLLAAAERINWEPGHIKEGRFGEWLKGNKDWAISRERYWATPLPVWRCAEKHTTVIGSYEELEKKRYTRPATILLVRHGEADNNVTTTLASGSAANGIHLTAKGKKQVAAVAKKLAKKKPVAVYASPLTRTHDTAEAIAVACGLSVISDERLQEIGCGVFNGKTEAEFRVFYEGAPSDRWTRAPEGAENWSDVRARMMSAIAEINAKHPGETVVVVTHGDPLFVLDLTLNQIGITEQDAYRYPTFASVTEVTLPNYPFNESGALDPHRPYIDTITLACVVCYGEAHRVPDVMDVWFDSGSMPLGQWHYPFENKERIDKNTSFPADYIAEAIDQTRGWFYTLLAVSTLLGYKDAPYKNVVCLNHILDAKGQKMSKSKGNVVDPWKMFEKYGADAVRLYLFIMNQPGDYKRFDEKDVDGVVKKTFLILWNVLAFYKLTQGARGKGQGANETKEEHILDRWLHSRLHLLIKEVTEHLEHYRPTDAGRLITDFITDLSIWYVRRSRDRFRAGADTALLHEALFALAKLLAPFTPMVADALYAELGGELPSVHLSEWPLYDDQAIDAKLIAEMDALRRVVESGHALRDEAGAKLRQPLAELEIEKGALQNVDELLPIIAEELNVKKVTVTNTMPEERVGWLRKSANKVMVALNTEITETLQREGWVREIQRQINDLRKEARLTPKDVITLYLDAGDIEFKSFLTMEKEHLMAPARASELLFERGEVAVSREIELDEQKLWIGVIEAKKSDK